MSENPMQCSVCPDQPMEKIEFKNPPLSLDACSRCGGIWFEHDKMNLLKQVQTRMEMKKIALRAEAFQIACQKCGQKMDRNADGCPGCFWHNRIPCPACHKSMQIVRVGKLKLDACKTCQGVWFDNVELGLLWNDRLALVKQNPHQVQDDAFLFVDVVVRSTVDAVSYSAFDTVTDIAGGVALNLATSTVETMGNGALELATGTIETIASGAIETTSGLVVDGLVQASGAVFEGIAGVILDMFTP